MNIIVFMKPVPNPEYYGKITIDPVSKRLVRDGIPAIINPADRCALEYALRIRKEQGGTVTVISMAPPFNAYELEKCLALGADRAILLSDRAFGGADTWATSYTLAKALEHTKIKPDLILAGNDSADGATAHVPSQIGEWLSLPHLTNIQEIPSWSADTISATKKVEGGTIRYEVQLPALLAVTKDSTTPRLIGAYGIKSLRSKSVEIWSKDDLPVDDDKIGLTGSPTQPGEIKVLDLRRESKELVGNEKEIARQIVDIMHKAGVKTERGGTIC